MLERIRQLGRKLAPRSESHDPRHTAPVIYDFGMNNGDDVEYYLLKCERVVGVDANASLCALAAERFAPEIAAGRLTIVNVALAERESAEPLTFYIHKTNHVLSQLPKPAPELLDEFTMVRVPCRTPASIVREFGPPLYVKIDVEYYDHKVLRNLFAAGVRPPFISAESHSIGVFACLVENGYDRFALVDGRSVQDVYGAAAIQALAGPRGYAFKEHMAGPFGDDIDAQWQNADTFFQTLAEAELGWKDIHARR